MILQISRLISNASAVILHVKPFDLADVRGDLADPAV